MTSTMGSVDRSIAPHSMQWAIRSRSKANRNGSNQAGFIYIDPTTLRRSNANANSVSSASHHHHHHHHTSSSAAAAAAAAAVATLGGNSGSSSSASYDLVTMSTTASALSRAFGVVVRQIADLMSILSDYNTMAPSLPRILEIGYADCLQLQNVVDSNLKPNWDWLLTVMDSTEAQLRFGSALSNACDVRGGRGQGSNSGSDRERSSGYSGR